MTASPKRPFLGVHYTTCATYGRLYKNDEGNAYEGRCPRCGHFFRVRIAPGGASTRSCQASCPPSYHNRYLR
ncbi:MAG: hypothetical protein JJU20_03070 [Opitutales bacterium]|nr:hypothetical protein [Opitutales bacterium]